MNRETFLDNLDDPHFLYAEFKMRNVVELPLRFGQWVINKHGIGLVWPELHYASNAEALSMLEKEYYTRRWNGNY